MEGTTQRIPVHTQSCCGSALIRPLILQDRQNECFLELTYCFRVLDPDPIHLPCEIFELELHKGCSLRHRESLNPITARVSPIGAVLSVISGLRGISTPIRTTGHLRLGDSQVHW